MSGTPLSALLSPSSRGSRLSLWVAASATTGDAWPAQRGTVVADRDLPRRIKSAPSTPDSRPPSKATPGSNTVVVAGRLSPTLLRALRTRPPWLVIVTGEAAASDLAALNALPDTYALGPHARLRVGSGDIVACGTDPGTCADLRRSLGADRIRLEIAPTPAWLPQWLEDPALRTCAVVGTVDARVLGAGWARWATQRDTPLVLVPVGLPEPRVDTPGHGSLTAVAAAHALERYTGPVFPSAAVIASVHGGLIVGPQEPEQPATRPTAGLWAQARRALPGVGATVGMEVPRVDTGASATSAFLAQRALLRAFAAQALAAAPQAMAPTPDVQGVARAEQLLANAGEVLTDHESKVVLRGFGLEVTRQAVASSASGASGFADRIGYPVGLKALSPDLRRRAEIGAVQLHLGTGAAVRRAYAAIVDNVEQRAPTARLDGVLVTEMIATGIDVYCGVVRLPGDDGLAIYGHTVRASAGAEPAMAILPLNATEATLLAHAIVTRLPVPGLRRADDPDVHGLAGVLLALATVAHAAADRIESVELSPLRLVSEARRAVVIDATIRQRPHLQGQ